MPLMDRPVLLDVSDRIATVTLNRPEARNALSAEVLALLPRLLEEADRDQSVDVIILTGADPAFCAGLDLEELGSRDTKLLGTGAESGRRAIEHAGRCRRCPSHSSAQSTGRPSPAGSSWR